MFIASGSQLQSHLLFCRLKYFGLSVNDSTSNTFSCTQGTQHIQFGTINVNYPDI